MTRREPPPSRDEQRVTDHVRPLGELDPSLCSMNQTRPMFDGNHNCWTCAYTVTGSTTHCHLYETCDRCRSDDNPCDTHRQIRQFAKSVPMPVDMPTPQRVAELEAELATARRTLHEGERE